MLVSFSLIHLKNAVTRSFASARAFQKRTAEARAEFSVSQQAAVASSVLRRRWSSALALYRAKFGQRAAASFVSSTKIREATRRDSLCSLKMFSLFCFVK